MNKVSRLPKAFLATALVSALLAACGGGGGDAASASASAPGSMLAAQTSLGSQLPALANKPVAAQYLAQIFTSDAAVSSEGPAGQDAANYRLTFEDSFDGDLDTGAWNVGRTGGGNATTNFRTSGGALQIWPERGADGNFFDRTLDTEGRFSQRYGYFEIEAKLPKGQGVWPAFWLFNQIGERRPEIDIMEAYASGETPWSAPAVDGTPSATMYAPVVWNDRDDRAGYGKIATPDLADGFHKYGVKWEPNRITFYFDGVEGYSIDATLSDPKYIILDLWFGSASGSPDASTPTGPSNAFIVNYVRAWQFR